MLPVDTRFKLDLYYLYNLIRKSFQGGSDCHS